MATKTLRCLMWGMVVLISSHVFAAEPIIVASGSGDQTPKQPQAAVASDGSVHMVYGVGNAVFHSRSTDGAKSFSPPKEAFRVPNMSLGKRRGPRIAVAGESVVVTAIGGEQGKGRDGDLLAWHSSDAGLTWEGPAKVNDVEGSAREGLHGMAAGADGTVWCVWLDLRNKGTEIHAAKSTDNGATWEPNVRVYRSPDGSVCQCCHPSVVVSGQDVYVLFRNLIAGNRDMYVAASKDGGAKFAPARKLGQGAWKLNACPMDGGMIAPDAKGSLITVWRRNGEIYASNGAGGKERMLGRGEQPWVTSSADGPVILWTSGREGELWLNTAAARQPQKLASLARDPMVTSAVTGDGPVVACWESSRDGQSVVVASVIESTKPKSR